MNKYEIILYSLPPASGGISYLAMGMPPVSTLLSLWPLLILSASILGSVLIYSIYLFHFSAKYRPRYDFKEKK